jgi:hypothetical protein
MKILRILACLPVAIVSSWGEARTILSNSGGSGVPTFTVGVGGAYADINAAVAAICAGAQGAVTGGCPGGVQAKNIVFQVTSGGITTAVLQNITGWDAGIFTTTLEPDPSGGFRAYLNEHPDNPLYFNVAYGGFILQTAGNDALDVNVNNFAMLGIQLMNSSGNSSSDGLYLGSNVAVATLDSNIIVASGAIHTHPEVFFTASGGAPLVKNNIIFGLDTTDSLDLTANSNINAYYNTFIMPVSTSNQGAGMLIAANGAVTVENNLALGFGYCGSGSVGGNNTGEGYIFNGGGVGNITASNNVTCMPDFVNNGNQPPAFGGRGALFQSDGQVRAVLATEIVGPFDGRLAATSVKAHGTALPLAGGITTDILGHPRNPYLDDAGAYSAGGITPPDLTGATQYVITSGISWTVGPACVGPHNWIEAIGGGGAGAMGTAHSVYTPSGGGGGGQYAAIYAYPFTPDSPGTSIPISVATAAPSGTNGGNTTFRSVLKAIGGSAGQNTVSTAPGGTGGIGTILHDGGNGGSDIGIYAGSGGGGAGGRNGHGANGGETTGDSFIFGGGGGGGGNGGSVGQNDGGTETGGGDGGAGSEGTSGVHGTAPSGTHGGVGGANGGGGGGGGNVSGGSAGMNGGAGGSGTEYGGSGPGGGAGGGALAGGAGGAGGGYGGGGGGSGTTLTSRILPGGTGAPGVLVVTCAP